MKKIQAYGCLPHPVPGRSGSLRETLRQTRQGTQSGTKKPSK